MLVLGQHRVNLIEQVLSGGVHLNQLGPSGHMVLELELNGRTTTFDVTPSITGTLSGDGLDHSHGRVGRIVRISVLELGILDNLEEFDGELPLNTVGTNLLHSLLEHGRGRLEVGVNVTPVEKFLNVNHVRSFREVGESSEEVSPPRISVSGGCETQILPHLVEGVGDFSLLRESRNIDVAVSVSGRDSLSSSIISTHTRFYVF